ncbi:MAG TPA: DUF2953 domain-containing protein [Clostridia bacterium]|nr:DUF2953 domain-containing protein [Clostridia bacterium]
MLLVLIILKILLYLLFFLVGLVLLLLIIPFNYSGQVLASDGLRAQIALGWAWRMLGISAEIEGESVDITLRILDKRVYKLKGREAGTKEEKPEHKPEEKKKEKKTRKGFSLKDIVNREFINEILEYLKRVLDIAKPKYFHLYGTYGFEDPSLTGMACGVSGIISSIIPHARLHLNPDFTQEIMDLDLRAEGSMVVGSLAYQTIRTVFKKPIRKILFRKRKS